MPMKYYKGVSSVALDGYHMYHIGTFTHQKLLRSAFAYITLSKKIMYSYLLLFFSSFLAATILPFYSEVILFTLLRQGDSAIYLVATASLGNTLGAAVNWYLGRFLLHYQDRRWFYFKEHQVAAMQHWFQKYGKWSLLFAWLPLGGDALTFIAGVMKVRFWEFFMLVGIGKTLRYIAVFYLAQISLSA